MYLLLVGATLLTIGLVASVREFYTMYNDNEFTIKFLNDFRVYSTALIQGNIDAALYERLIKDSHEMQMKMGVFGYASHWSPPYSNVTYRDYQLIINLIPETARKSMGNTFGGGSFTQREILSYITTIDDTLLRYNGYLENKITKLRREVFNPFIWLREGVRIIVQIPVLLLLWFGIIPKRIYNRIAESLMIKVLSLVVTLAGLISSLVTIVTGYNPFITVLKSWLNL